MSNLVVSYIRTWVPVLIGAVLAWLTAHGLPIPSNSKDVVVPFLTAALILAYYSIVRAVEQKFPQVGILLGKVSAVIYAKPDSDGSYKITSLPDASVEITASAQAGTDLTVAGKHEAP